MDFIETRRKTNLTRKIILVAALTLLVFFLINWSSSTRKSIKVHFLSLRSNKSCMALSRYMFLLHLNFKSPFIFLVLDFFFFLVNQDKDL